MTSDPQPPEDTTPAEPALQDTPQDSVPLPPPPSPPSYGTPGYETPPGYGPAVLPPGITGGGYGVPRGVHPESTKVLILGILSLLCCGFLGPFAWYIGNRVVREIEATPGPRAGYDTAHIGRILGIISTVVLVVGTLFNGLGGLGGLLGSITVG